MELLEHTKLQVFTQDYPNIIELFDKLDIDYYCFGERTLEEACQKQNLDLQEVVNKVQLFLKENPNPDNFEKPSLERLLDFVEQIHVDIRNKLRDLKPKAPLFFKQRKHEKLQVELIKVLTILENQLGKHHKLEEEFSLPYFRNLQHEEMGKVTDFVKSYIGNLKQHLEIMKLEHEVIARQYHRIRQILDLYQGEGEGVQLEFLNDFKEFAKLLKVYIHTENNLVFPKVIELSKH